MATVRKEFRSARSADEVWAVLRKFDPAQPVWGFNINRCIKRHEGFARFAAHTQDSSFFRIAQAGDLAGFDGAEQGIGLDITPFFVLRTDDERGGDGR